MKLCFRNDRDYLNDLKIKVGDKKEILFIYEFVLVLIIFCVKGFIILIKRIYVIL